MKLIMHTTIWGRHHTDVFLKYCLSSILGQKNISDYVKKIEFQYNIFTTKECSKLILSNNNYAELEKKFNVKINIKIIDEEIIKNNDHVKVNNIFINKTLSEVISKKAAFCWIIPDVIHPNNFLKKICENYLEGNRMILAPSQTRCCKEILEILDNDYKNKKNHISITSEELTKISFSYICRISAYKNYYNYYNPAADQQIYYKFKGNYICHATSPDPVFIYPETNNVEIKFHGISFEGSDILEKLVPNLNDIEIIRDTSVLNTVTVERESIKEENIKIINKRCNYNFFNRPFFINFLSYLLKNKHSSYAVKYFQQPVLHRIDSNFVDINELKLQKPTMFISNVVNAYFKFYRSNFLKKSIILLFESLRLILRLRRKFFIKEKIINADKY